MIRCDCKDCLNIFYGEKAHHYSDDPCLYHHPKCNHITQKDFDKIEFEAKVWIEDLGLFITKDVVHWSGYRCTCEKISKEEE